MSSIEIDAAVGILTAFAYLIGAGLVVALVTWAAWTAVQQCREQREVPIAPPQSTAKPLHATKQGTGHVAASAGRTAAHGADRGQG